MSSPDDAVKEMREMSESDAEWAHYRIHLREMKLCAVRWTVYDNYSPDAYKFVLDEKGEPRRFPTLEEARSFLNANAVREHVHPDDLLPEHPSFWKVEKLGATPRLAALPRELAAEYGAGNALFSRAVLERCMLTKEEKHEVEESLGYAPSDERICAAANAYANWSVVQMELDLLCLSRLPVTETQSPGMTTKLEGLRIALAVRRVREKRLNG